MKRQKRSIPANLMLWEVLYEGHYYDNDPRMPGNSLADKRFFVLAENYQEAMEKAKPLIKKHTKSWHKETKITANVLALENLVAARNSKDDGRMGWFSIKDLGKVELSCKEDKEHFRLGVCLIPVESKPKDEDYGKQS